jgi:hypothetical protein
MLDSSEIAALVIADHGESWTSPAGAAFTAAFVRGVSRGDDAEAGRELRERGTLTILAEAVSLDEDQIVTRASNSSQWLVTLAMPVEHGMQVFEIERMTRVTLGKM